VKPDDVQQPPPQDSGTPLSKLKFGRLFPKRFVDPSPRLRADGPEAFQASTGRNLAVSFPPHGRIATFCELVPPPFTSIRLSATSYLSLLLRVIYSSLITRNAAAPLEAGIKDLKFLSHDRTRHQESFFFLRPCGDLTYLDFFSRNGKFFFSMIRSSDLLLAFMVSRSQHFFCGRAASVILLGMTNNLFVCCRHRA